MRTPETVAPASGWQQAEKSRQDAGGTERVSIRSRGRLPHWERAEGTYFVTFRLADTLPVHVLESWEAERREIEAVAKRHGRELNAQERRRLHDLYTERIDAYLDSGVGECWLRTPEIARIVVRAIQFFDGQRYRLHAWCVMSNHVHAVFTVAPASNRHQRKTAGRMPAVLSKCPSVHVAVCPTGSVSGNQTKELSRQDAAATTSSHSSKL
jgi:hypothetical protein